MSRQVVFSTVMGLGYALAWYAQPGERRSVRSPVWEQGNTQIMTREGDLIWREAFCYSCRDGPNCQIRSSKHAFDVMKTYYDQVTKVESFLVMFLDKDRYHLCTEVFSKGGKSEAFVDVMEIIKRAKKKRAKALYVAHNHPSDRLWASSSDDDVTETLKRECARNGLVLEDHIIVSKNDFYSSKTKRSTRDPPPIQQREFDSWTITSR